MIALLALYCLEYGTPGGTARFAIIIKAVFIAYTVGPTIMAGFFVGVISKKLQGLLSVINRSGMRQEATFPDVFLVAGKPR